MATLQRTRIKRKTPLKSETPIKKVNHKRTYKRRKKQEGPKAVWTRKQLCEVSGRDYMIVAGHVEHSRGAGGTSEHVVPLNAEVEADWHGMDNAQFCAKWKRTKDSVKRAAPMYEDMYQRHVSGEPYHLDF